MTSKKIFVTGGNGYIGSEIVKKLVERGDSPYLLLRPGSNRERIKNVLQACTIIEGSLVDNSLVSEMVKKISPDIIFHLASTGVYSYMDTSNENINKIIDSNVRGAYNLFFAVKDIGCELFINTGSCFEYGSRNLSFSEEDSPRPVNMYGVAKATGTLMAEMFFRQYNLPIITLRPFTVYGSGEGPGRFITTVIKNCYSHQNPRLVKEKIIRDYIFIDDVVDAFLAVVERGNKVIGETINISTGIGTSIEQVARIIMSQTKVLDLKVEKGAFPTRIGEVFSLVGNPKKIQKLIDWRSKFNLEEGIKKTIEDLRINLPV